MMSHEVCLRKFGQHCRLFYDGSLVLRSSSSLSSMQEEKKTDEPTLISPDDMKKRHDDGKIVLETLDRINAIGSIVVSIEGQSQQQQQDENSNVRDAMQKSIATMRQEHALVVERHRDVLLECGLVDIDRFLESSATNDDPVNQNGNGTTKCMLQQYIQMRDAMRQRAHKLSILHRQNSLFELLSEVNAVADCTDTSNSSKPHLTQLKIVQQTISTIQKFVNKYQSNIGSHPFLAGLFRIIDSQTNSEASDSRDPNYIVRWKFRGSVLTEACRSCHGKHNENEDDELAYAREAIEVLFSFLTWIKDIDVEGGGGLIVPVEENDLGLDQILQSSQHSTSASSTKEQSEPILSFEVDKHISNANLRRILAVLPDPKRLDARATGSIEIMKSGRDTTNPTNECNIAPRLNIDGHEDEQWPWFARFEFCNLL